MKIIQITPYYSPHIGGMENCVREISERLARKGQWIKVITSDVGSNIGKTKIVKNIKIEYLKAWEFAHTPIIPQLFFKLFNSPKGVIFHVHISQPLVPEVAWIVSKIRNIPYIAHVHVDIEPTGKMGFILPLYKKIFLKKVLQSARKIVVPTNDYIDLISKKYSISKNNIVVIPYGVDLNKFQCTSTKLHNPIRLLFVGRLTKQKNLPLLINSVRKIVDEGKYNITLHIVGEGEDKNKLLNLIKELDLKNHIVLHGSLSGKNLHNIYSYSDIFILTSVYESFGIVLIEAMASGLPIIVSDIPAIRNVVKNNQTGLLVKPTMSAISGAIEKLISNSELREKLINNGLKEVKKYDWDNIVNEFEAVYREVLHAANKN